jgi:type VI secretion system protein ImpH
MNDEPQTVGARLLAEPELFDPAMAAHVARTNRSDLEASRDFVSHATNRHVATPLGAVRARNGELSVHANYLGLIGPVSALPPLYTRQALLERRRRATSYFDFLEIFAARLREIFIASDRKYRLAFLLQAFGFSSENKVVAVLYALCGFVRKSNARSGFDESWILYFAGYFSNQRRTAAHLQRMLADFLQLDVSIEQFQERRLPISPDEQTRLTETALDTCILGQTAVAGSLYSDRRSAIRIRIGPLRYFEYLSLMPDRPRFFELTQLVRLYVGPAVSFDIQLVLSCSEIPETQLNTHSAVGRIGWNVWALSRPPPHDSDDTIFDPDQLEHNFV